MSEEKETDSQPQTIGEDDLGSVSGGVDHEDQIDFTKKTIKATSFNIGMPPMKK